MKTILKESIFFGQYVKLEKALKKRDSVEEFPEPFKWSLQLLYFNGIDWIEICRIDNHLHKNRPGSHVHIIGKQEVRWMKMSFVEAENTIKEMGSGLLHQKFNVEIHFKG